MNGKPGTWGKYNAIFAHALAGESVSISLGRRGTRREANNIQSSFAHRLRTKHRNCYIALVARVPDGLQIVFMPRDVPTTPKAKPEE